MSHLEGLNLEKSLIEGLERLTILDPLIAFIIRVSLYRMHKILPLGSHIDNPDRSFKISLPLMVYPQISTYRNKSHRLTKHVKENVDRRLT